MKSKLAIITGATSGIGEAYALALAKAGWNLLITGRRENRLLALKNKIETTYSTKVHIVKAEFYNKEEFERLLNTINSFKKIDLLVNNAGFGCANGFFDANYLEQQKMLHVHVTASTKLIYTILPKMIENKEGAIINISSLSAFFPTPLNYFYCSTKAFMVSFSECLYIDQKHKNIKVQALCPGFIKTEFHTRMNKNNHHSWAMDKLLWMQPEQVVDYSLKMLKNKAVVCIPGMINKVLYYLSKMIPRRIYYVLMTHLSSKVSIKKESVKPRELVWVKS